jgi:hypothetical protein
MRDRLGPALAHIAIGAICIGLLLSSRNVQSGGRTGDFPVFLSAGRSLLAGEPLYTPGRGEGYIYGPFPALLFAPLTHLGPAGCAWTLGIANAAMVWLTALLGARECVRRLGRPPVALLVTLTGLIGLLLTLDKVRSVMSGGQTDMLIVFPLVLALTWKARRPFLCGAALGFAGNIKYISLVFLPYLLWRRQWKAAGATVVSTLVFALAPALVSGWHQNIAQWRVALGGMARLLGANLTDEQAAPIAEVTRSNSISVTSALSRWLVDGHGRGAAFGATAAIGAAYFCLCWSMYRRNRTPLLIRMPDDPREPALSLVEWSGLLVGLLAFSPQTQGRHFVLLFPLHLAAGVMLLRPRVARWPLVLGLLLTQAGLNLPPAGFPSCEHSLEVWRRIGGASWCLLGMYLLFLHTGLRTANAIAQEQEQREGMPDGTGSPAQEIVRSV